jgi:hydroxymethylbilane synthase
VTIRVGTRGSALALAQAGQIADRLAAVSGDAAELVTITSEGDVNQASLSRIGGMGVFAGALRIALLDGRCDVVVHSLKDLPTQPADGLVVLAVPERADARDALCARDGLTLADLPAGARIGTGSPRRRAQLLSRRPDLEIVDIRGNVDTRLSRVTSGDLDAVLLSRAGLERLGRLDSISDLLDLDGWPTAPGQGALAIEVRAEDAAHLVAPFPAPTSVGAAVSALDDVVAHASARAERAVLRGLEAGCSAPIGVHATAVGGVLALHSAVYGDGRFVEDRRESSYDSADLSTLAATVDRVSREAVAGLLESGAADLAPLGVAS